MKYLGYFLYSVATVAVVLFFLANIGVFDKMSIPDTSSLNISSKQEESPFTQTTPPSRMVKTIEYGAASIAVFLLFLFVPMLCMAFPEKLESLAILVIAIFSTAVFVKFEIIPTGQIVLNALYLGFCTLSAFVAKDDKTKWTLLLGALFVNIVAYATMIMFF